MHIFIDLDGLGANWVDYVLKYHFPFKDIDVLNQHPDRLLLTRDMYRKDPNLFYKLEPIKQFGKLLKWLTDRNVPWNILTAAESCHECYETVVNDKLRFLKEKFDVSPEKVIVTKTSSDKVNYSGVGKGLIDDFERNCREWEASGGIAWHVEANVYCVDELLTRIEQVLIT